MGFLQTKVKVWWSSCSVWVWIKQPRTIPGFQHIWNSSWNREKHRRPQSPTGPSPPLYHTQAEHTEVFLPFISKGKE